jgi:hypothetical protein
MHLGGHAHLAPRGAPRCRGEGLLERSSAVKRRKWGASSTCVWLASYHAAVRHVLPHWAAPPGTAGPGARVPGTAPPEALPYGGPGSAVTIFWGGGGRYT